MADTTARTCLFCDEPAGSREHAFPHWLQKFANPTLAPAEIVRGKATHRSSGYNNFITKAICNGCNTVWLAGDFEGPGARLIRAMWERSLESDPEPMELTADDQTFIAAWAYKTALVLTACTDGGTEIAKAEFERFRETGLPPVESIVRLAWSNFPTLALATVKITAEKACDEDSVTIMRDEGAAGFVAVLLVGPLVLWIARAPVEYLAEDHFHPPFAAIWPAPLLPQWPPAQEPLEKQHLEALVAHLNTQPDFGDEPFPR